MSADANGNAALLKEWETARELLKGFDERLHDLRKYGFSFITGLLAIEGLFFPKQPSPDQMSLEIIRVTVLVANLILIVALRLIDRNYEVFQTAAATRACVLERVLNLELTEVICQRFDDTNVRGYVNWIYYAFTIAVFCLGVSALWSDFASIMAVLVLCGITILLIRHIMKTVGVTYPNGFWDWTLERVDCTQGEMVGITLTNLQAKASQEKGGLIIPSGTEGWKLLDEDGVPQDTRVDWTKGLKLKAQESYTWLINTKLVSAGVYGLSRYLGEKGWSPLNRKLRVRPKEPTKSDAHARLEISV